MNKISDFELALGQLGRGDLDWESNFSPTLDAILELAKKLDNSPDLDRFYKILNQFLKKLPKSDKFETGHDLLSQLEKLIKKNSHDQISVFNETDQKLLIPIIEEYNILKKNTAVKEFIHTLNKQIEKTEIKTKKIEEIEKHIKAIKEILKKIE